jgi:hypothetical protein
LKEKGNGDLENVVDDLWSIGNFLDTRKLTDIGFAEVHPLAREDEAEANVGC